MTTLKKVYDLVVGTIRIVNRSAKKTDDKQKRKLYRIKNESILEAVEIILTTQTKSVRFELDFDKEKNMNYITFFFKKEKYVKYEKVSFHLMPKIYKEIKNLQETM